jgi:hypothetical protein
MMMRVKLVIISSIAGRKVMLVSSSRVWIDSDHWVPPPAAALLVTAGKTWAWANAGARSDARNSALRSSRPGIAYLLCVSRRSQSGNPSAEEAPAPAGWAVEA